MLIVKKCRVRVRSAKRDHIVHLPFTFQEHLTQRQKLPKSYQK